MSKNVQISQETFLKLVQFFYIENHDEDIYKSIQSDIEHKIDSVVKRELYTQYKTSNTEQERETARQKYLEMIGMHKDWRW